MQQMIHTVTTHHNGLDIGAIDQAAVWLEHYLGEAFIQQGSTLDHGEWLCWRCFVGGCRGL